MFVERGRRSYAVVMGSEPMVSIGPAGLVRVTWLADEGQRTVVVRVRSKRGGRLRVRELHVQEPTPVGLRELRLGAIERLVTHPDMRAEILKRIDEQSPDVFEVFPGRVHLKRGTASMGGPPQRPRRLDEAFFLQLAAEHKAAVEAMRPIVPTLSERYGAPPDTVSRWLKQARRDGFIEKQP